MICPKCNSEINSDVRFCTYCGEPIPTFIECPQCGKTTAATSPFCIHCGAKVAPDEAMSVKNGTTNEVITDKIVDKCPSCGAAITFDENTTEAYCSYCNSRIRIAYKKEFDPKQYEDIGSFLVPLSVTRQQAEKACLEFMAKAPDIDSAVFDHGRVIEMTPVHMPFYCTKYHADISYTASIGYDRTESYVAVENRTARRNLPGGKYEYYQKQVPVTKTRTVTDWRPFSNSESNVTFDAYTCASSSIKPFFQNGNILSVSFMEEIFSKDAALVINEFVLSSDVSELSVFEQSEVSGCKLITSDLTVETSLKEFNGAKVYSDYAHSHCRSMLPSGAKVHHRDLHLSIGSTQLEFMYLTYIPIWIVRYAFGGKQYTMLVNASSAKVIADDLPKSNTASDKLNQIEAETQKKTAGISIACIATGALIGCFCLLGNSISMVIGLLIGGVLGLFVALIIANSVRKSGNAKLEEQKAATRMAVEERAKGAKLFANIEEE